jgi:hypothetical protein
MARSNGPFGPVGARPPARRHPADDAFAAPAGQPNGHWPPPQYPDPAHAGQQGQGYHFPPEPDLNHGYQQPPPAPYNGYQGGQQPDPYATPQWGQPDPQAYDLGNYMPSGAQGYPNGGQQPYPAMDPPPFHQQGHDPYAQGHADSEAEYDDEFADDDEPGRGRRWMFIVAALVGAVGVGGALAYTYKSFVAPSGGRVPLVKAEPNVKVRPAAANDKRMQGRLGEDAGQQNTAAEDDRAGNDEQGGPRRVRTIPITPGGGPPGIQVTPPAQQAAAPPSIPGIMLENMGPRPQQTPPRAAPQPGPQPPQRVTIGQPPPSLPPPQQAEEPPARRAPAPPPQVAKAPPPAPPRAAPAAAPPPAANTGAGYVAVLSSQKSRMDALKAFADLQQKYGEALSGRVPDVQEANLGEKGIWYRVVVGPPGSRDAANGVCSQLKTAGYGSCWVNAY